MTLPELVSSRWPALRLAVGLWLTLLAASSAGVAHAQPTDVSTLDAPSKAALLTALNEANAAFDRGDFPAALAGYDRALSFAQIGDVEYRRALCLERLDRFGEAADALRSHLRLTPTIKDRARIEAEIARLDARAAAMRRARLQVLTTPAGADVRLGGPDAPVEGQTPLTLSVEPGEVTLHLSAVGYQAAARRVVATPNEAVVLELALEPVPSAPQAGATTVEAKPPSRTIPFVLLGVGGALAITSGAMAYLTEAKIKDANAYNRQGAGNTRGELDDKHAEIGRYEKVFWVTGAAAVGALATGAIWWATLPDSPEQPPAAPAARVTVSPAYVGLDVPF